jgi:hypothetical protein
MVFAVPGRMTQERQNMQSNRKMHRMLLTALVATGMATLSAQAWTWYPTDTFDTAPGVPGDGSSFLVGAANRTYNPFIDQPWIGSDSSAGTPAATETFTWAGSVDAANNPLSGSVDINWSWNEGGGAEKEAFNIDLYGTGQLLLSPGDLSFDYMVGANSPLGLYGDGGYFQVFTKNNGYTWDSGHVNAGLASAGTLGTWQHVDIPLAAGTNVRALAFQIYGGRNLVGTTTLYLDNLQLIPEPSTIAMLVAGGALLVGAVRRARSA